MILFKIDLLITEHWEILKVKMREGEEGGSEREKWGTVGGNEGRRERKKEKEECREKGKREGEEEKGERRKRERERREISVLISIAHRIQYFLTRTQNLNSSFVTHQFWGSRKLLPSLSMFSDLRNGCKDSHMR